MGAAAGLISFAGGLAGCDGDERKMGWVRPRVPSRLPVVWPDVVVKRENWEWVRPRVPFTLDEPQIDRTWLLCAPLG